MDILTILLVAGSLFFAINMGGSGIAPSFSAALGANILKKYQAVLLFTIFVTAGAFIFGGFVSATLGKGMVSTVNMNLNNVLIIIFSASLSLLLANIMKVPQSTSWVTVFSIAVTGLYYSDLNTEIILFRLLPAWIILPVLSFLITMKIVKIFYPLREKNFALFEKFSKYEWKMKIFVIIGSCYIAFAIGSNNVANVVGPLAASDFVETKTGLLIFAPVFGIGSLIFTSATRTIGKEIVPLGPFTATIIKFVFGTLLIIASWLGLPQSIVQLNTASVIAVSYVKDGGQNLKTHKVLKKIFLLWLITPFISASLTLLLLMMFS